MSNRLNKRSMERRVLARATNKAIKDGDISNALTGMLPDPEQAGKSALTIGSLPEFESPEPVSGLCKRRESKGGLSRFACSDMILRGLEEMHVQGAPFFPEPENDICIAVNFPKLWVKGKLHVLQPCIKAGEEQIRQVDGEFVMRMENILASARFRFDKQLEWVELAHVEIEDENHDWSEQIKMDAMEDLRFPELMESKEVRLQIQILAAMTEANWQEKVASQMKLQCRSDKVSEIMTRVVNEKLA